MRNGPLVHRRAHVSRFAYGSPTPLDRLASLASRVNGLHATSGRTGSRSTEAEFDPRRLHLGSRLPINLRQFLAQQLGSIARVEEDAIVALGSRSSEMLMRELARAIRRFSAERAREAWSECAIGMDRLAHEFFGADADERAPVVLCLKCSCVGTGALDQHSGPNCLSVDLGSAVRAEQIKGRGAIPTADTMHRAVENFRAVRTSAGLPHYDVDCYVAGGQVIFTWRPLPARN